MGADRDSDLGQWITCRTKSQALLLELHRAHGGHGQRPPFQFLVGAAFCLWRSAFMLGAESSFPAAALAADKILTKLLHDNSILYGDEKTAQDWFVGFYLNSAELRIRFAGTRMNLPPGTNQAFDALAEKVDEYVRARETDAPISWGPLTERWFRAYEAANSLLLELTRDASSAP